MRIAFLIWLACLLCLSLSPFEVKAELHSMGRYHNAGHVIAFAITAVLLLSNARAFAVRAALCLVAALIALATELLERMRFHNAYEWRDVFTDCAGILLGLLIVIAAQALLRGRNPVSRETGSFYS